MNIYAKRFMISAVIYIIVGILFGLTEDFLDLMPKKAEIYSHVHFNLLGFVMMMTMGICYTIIPKFTGNKLTYESLLPLQYWLHQIGLIILIVGFYIEKTQHSVLVFIIGGLIAFTSILIFAANVISTLNKPQKG